jgi:hypothetical protein
MDMDLTVSDAMGTALWRLHDAALERAALIYTFARSTSEDSPAGHAIYGRQLATLIDLIHEFCFNARRAIERAETCRPGMIEELQNMDVHGGKQSLELSELDYPRVIALSQESYWWVLDRLVHSPETHVVYRTVEAISIDHVSGSATGWHNTATGYQNGYRTINQPVAVGFCSDRDSDRIDQYVELEGLVMHYIGRIGFEIEEAIRTRNQLL